MWFDNDFGLNPPESPLFSSHTRRVRMLHNAFPIFLLIFYTWGLLLAKAPLTAAMANKAKPNYVKSQELMLLKEILVSRAVEEYNGQSAPRSSGDFLGYRKITNKVMEDHANATKSKNNPRGERIDVNWTTVRRRDEGTKSLLQTRAEDPKAYLTPEEDEILTEFLQNSADRGFPCSNKRVKEAAFAIVRKRKPSASRPSDSWLMHFLNRKQARKELAKYWSKSLKSDRGKAVNANTHSQYFDLLDQLYKDNDFHPECIYGGDESAFMKGVGEKEHVVGRHGKKIQHQIRGVDRENTTVICTICADGTSISPLIIFKGTAFRIKWLEQDNPIGASLAHQKKGWTNHELGLEWAKDFDRKTKTKARGRTRLLFVDGHSSHYTYEFINYCAENNIVLVCYPANSTHIYQGLDVVCFGSMKTAWREACLVYEDENGGALTKDSFIAVFAEAYCKAFTPETIKSAFRKTGVWPLNREVVSVRDMAPSISTSTTTSYVTSSIVTPSEPLSLLLTAIEMAEGATRFPTRLVRTPRTPARTSPLTTRSVRTSPATRPSEEDPVLACIDPTLLEEGRRAIAAIGETNPFLFSSSPIRSSSNAATPPRLFRLTATVSPRGKALLAHTPATDLEAVFQESLKSAISRESKYADDLDQERSRGAVNLILMNKTQKQLHNNEEKKKKRKETQLVVTGNAVCLTSDDMKTRAKDLRDAKAAEEAAKTAKKKTREELDVLRKAWNKDDADRKARNRDARVKFKDDKAAYDVEKARCKAARLPFTMPKPSLVIEKPVPQPWKDSSGPVEDVGAVEDGVEDAEEVADHNDHSGDEEDQLSD